MHRDAAAKYWAAIFEPIESEFELGELSEHGVTDAALVWCNEHWGDVADAAAVLGIGLDDSTEIPHSLTVTEAGSDYTTQWYVGDFVAQDSRIAMWLSRHVEWASRSCLAAFEAR